MKETNSFNGRMNLTKTIEDSINSLFNESEILLVPYGVLKLLKSQKDIKDYLSELSVNNKHAEMILKFAPDYIIFKKTETKKDLFS